MKKQLQTKLCFSRLFFKTLLEIKQKLNPNVTLAHEGCFKWLLLTSWYIQELLLLLCFMLNFWIFYTTPYNLWFFVIFMQRESELPWFNTNNKYQVENKKIKTYEFVLKIDSSLVLVLNKL